MMLLLSDILMVSVMSMLYALSLVCALYISVVI